jgi:tripartite-type tricarboxylate transporter receptor subunit TctC
MIRTIPKGTALAAATLALCALAPMPAAADAVEDFYKGKSMRMIISTSPGAGYDVYARFMARHLGRFIPGKPSFVNQNMPGAGHMRAGQFMSMQAPRDGSAIATISQGMPFSQISTPQQVKFDTSKFLWIGNPIEINNVLELWHTTGVKSLKDMQQKEIVLGASGAASTSGLYPRAMNNILGTKFKIIVGFKGGSEMNLAMERGEISGRGSNSWASLKGITPQYLAEKKVIIPVQMGLKREKDLPDVPMLWELGRNQAETQVLRMMSSLPAIGRPLFTPPDVPAERVKALRKAFDETVKSKAFLDEAARAKLEINPVSGEEIQKIVEEMVNAPADVKKLVQAAVTKGAVFDCKALVKDAKLCAPAKKKKKKKSS